MQSVMYECSREWEIGPVFVGYLQGVYKVEFVDTYTGHKKL